MNRNKLQLILHFKKKQATNKLILIINDGVSKGRLLFSSVAASVPSVAFITLRPMKRHRQMRHLRQLRQLRCVRYVRCVACVALLTSLKLVLNDELAGWVGTRLLGRRTPRHVDEVVTRLYVFYARFVWLCITASRDSTTGCGKKVAP